MAMGAVQKLGAPWQRHGRTTEKNRNASWATDSRSSARPAMSGAKCCRSWPSGNFPVDDVVALASAAIGRQAGFVRRKSILKVQDLAKFDFKGIDIVLVLARRQGVGRAQPARGQGRLRRDRQHVVLAHGSRTCRWSCPRSTPRPSPATRARHHRQSQLLDHPDGGGAEAAARRRPTSSASWCRPISRRRAPAARRWTSS